jgi:uncharacterized protein YgiM (DUF1202 family)
MKRCKYLLLLLPVTILACSLTASPIAGDQAGAKQSLSEPVKIDLEGAALTAPSQVSPSPVPTPERCIVTTDVLQLRACAGTHCTVLDWLKEGEKLVILDANDGWLHVQTLAGKTGWVKAKYCGGPT